MDDPRALEAAERPRRLLAKSRHRWHAAPDDPLLFILDDGTGDVELRFRPKGDVLHATLTRLDREVDRFEAGPGNAAEAEFLARLDEAIGRQAPGRASDGTKGTLSLPNLEGGANWEAGAVDPETGILYVGSQTIVSRRALTHDPEASDIDYILGGYSAPKVSGLPLVKPPWGRITAIDLNTGEHLWMVPNGDTPEQVKNHPALRGLDLARTGKATRAGILVTKTLVFAGEGYGGDPVFRAYDKRTGEIIAEIELPASQVGLPMTYMLEGRQYIVMSVGGPGHPAELVALTLPVEEREREEE